MCARGIDLIELLLRHCGERAAGHHGLSNRIDMNAGIPLTTMSDGIPRLDLKTIAVYLATDKPASSPTMGDPTDGADNLGLSSDLGNLDVWLQYFDSSLMP